MNIENKLLEILCDTPQNGWMVNSKLLSIIMFILKINAFKFNKDYSPWPTLKSGHGKQSKHSIENVVKIELVVDPLAVFDFHLIIFINKVCSSENLKGLPGYLAIEKSALKRVT